MEKDIEFRKVELERMKKENELLGLRIEMNRIAVEREKRKDSAKQD